MINVEMELQPHAQPGTVIRFARCTISITVFETILTKDPATGETQPPGGALDLSCSKAAEG